MHWRMACSINTAWLSVASSVAALVVPSAYRVVGEVEWVAVSLAAVFTVIGVHLSRLATGRCLLAGACYGGRRWQWGF